MADRCQRPQIPFGEQVRHLLYPVVVQRISLITTEGCHVVASRIPVRYGTFLNLSDLGEIVLLEELTLLLVCIIMCSLVTSRLAAAVADVSGLDRNIA